MSDEMEKNFKKIRPQSQSGEIDPVLRDLFSKMKAGESKYKDLIDLYSQAIAETSDADYGLQTCKLLASGGGLAEKDKVFFQDKLKNSILVDLGGGYWTSMADETAKDYSASALINVDKFMYPKDMPYDPLTPQDPGRSGAVLSYPRHVFVRSDMLDFVARLPDNSVNFMANGIDMFIMGRPSGINLLYRSALGKEIVRAMKSGGIIFGNQFDYIWDEFDENQDVVRRRVALPEGFMNDIRVYEKQKEV